MSEVIPASRNYTGAPVDVRRVPRARPQDEGVPRPADFGFEPVTPELGHRLITALRSVPSDRPSPVRPFLPKHLLAEHVP